VCGGCGLRTKSLDELTRCVGCVGCVGCGGVGGVGGVGVWGHPLRSNIPRSALCATLDTYNLHIFYF
jgi:hypothetical protein